MQILYAFNVEEFIMEIYLSKGYTREQVFSLPLKDIWYLIKDYKTRSKASFWIKKK
jgi:hypothetical protein